MTSLRQIADQLESALRQLYEHGENCPDDDVLRAIAAYNSLTEHQGSHWDECWREHHDCAIAKIEELKAMANTALDDTPSKSRIKRINTLAAIILKGALEWHRNEDGDFV